MGHLSFKNISVATNAQGKCVCLRWQKPRGVVHNGYYYVAVDAIPTGSERMTYTEALEEFARQCAA